MNNQVLYDWIQSYYNHKFSVDYYLDLSDLIPNATKPEIEQISQSELLSPFDLIRQYFYPLKLKKDDKLRFLKQLFETYYGPITIKDTILYDHTLVSLRLIHSLSDYQDALSQLQVSPYGYMFRGHANMNYKLEPSVFRNNNWKMNEQHMYEHMLIACPDDFEGLPMYIDRLVKMQHYGLPTRLLDVTWNALVALYFACLDAMQGYAEVVVFDFKAPLKYPSSSHVMALSALASLSCEQKENIMNHLDSDEATFQDAMIPLYHKIRKLWAFFEPTLTKEDIQHCVAICAVKQNKRMIQQDGAFILFGLGNRIQTEHIIISNEKWVIPGKVKKAILKSLEQLSIHHGTLFPEIDEVALFLKDKYQKST